MKDLRITLVQDRPDRPFYSGSSITGSLVAVVDEPKRYEDISIHFLGKAKVEWEECLCCRSKHNVLLGTVTYRSKKVYVKQSLWTVDQSSDGRLPPGQHTCPFRFDVPRYAPSSYAFEGSVGWIRYELRIRIRIRIEKGFLKFDHEVRRSVPVQQVVDMSNPRLLQPICQEVQKRFCFLCRSSAQIVLTVKLLKKDYCKGEALPYMSPLRMGAVAASF